MNYNQYDYYNAKGGRREKQLNEYKNPIIPIEELRRITDTEKEYLGNVIKPFRDDVKYITKSYNHILNTRRIIIKMANGEDSVLLPPLKPHSTMYKGMKDNTHYTLEELGL